MKANRAVLALAISAGLLAVAGYAIGQQRAASDVAADETAANNRVANVAVHLGHGASRLDLPWSQ